MPFSSYIKDWLKRPFIRWTWRFGGPSKGQTDSLADCWSDTEKRAKKKAGDVEGKKRGGQNHGRKKLV